ncbi:hypothetical protein CEXT_132291 [Caerostris extrusa]|uniref:Uncharacterized protein n=1 Tax=Caerostris extrusa TaxID=172846 RepID=A0AAV4QZC6_CAEEX|nr:hypothetical protein CEXT_132291 [Caerostris extrusa]
MECFLGDLFVSENRRDGTSELFPLQRLIKSEKKRRGLFGDEIFGTCLFEEEKNFAYKGEKLCPRAMFCLNGGARNKKKKGKFRNLSTFYRHK